MLLCKRYVYFFLIDFSAGCRLSVAQSGSMRPNWHFGNAGSLFSGRQHPQQEQAQGHPFARRIFVYDHMIVPIL